MNQKPCLFVIFHYKKMGLLCWGWTSGSGACDISGYSWKVRLRFEFHSESLCLHKHQTSIKMKSWVSQAFQTSNACFKAAHIFIYFEPVEIHPIIHQKYHINVCKRFWRLLQTGMNLVSGGHCLLLKYRIWKSRGNMKERKQAMKWAFTFLKKNRTCFKHQNQVSALQGWIALVNTGQWEQKDNWDQTGKWYKACSQLTVLLSAADLIIEINKHIKYRNKAHTKNKGMGWWNSQCRQAQLCAWCLQSEGNWAVPIRIVILDWSFTQTQIDVSFGARLPTLARTGKEWRHSQKIYFPYHRYLSEHNYIACGSCIQQ